MLRWWVTILLCVSCASTGSFLRPAAKTAEELYKQAVEDMEDGLYPEAITAFTDLKSKYPYTPFAALADLRIADTQLKRGQHSDAVDAYRSFLKYHPNHKESPYALLQIGEAYFEQLPEEWWFLPPIAEKDQANTRLAIAAYQDFLSRFGQDALTKTAQDRIRKCRMRLAEHEMYVARFYLDRALCKAAAARAEGLLQAYEGLGFDAEALWIAGSCRLSLGEKQAAAAHLGELAARFPDSPHARDAQGLLPHVPSP